MKSIDKFFLSLFLLFQVNFFDLINIKDTFLNGIASYSQKKVMMVIVLFYFIIRPFYSEMNLNRWGNFTFFVLFLLVAWLLVIWGTIKNFGQSTFSTFLSGYYFFMVLLYFVYSKIMTNWLAWRDLSKIFIIFSTILSTTKLLQSIFLSKFHTLFFFLNTNNDYNTALQLRFTLLGFTRIPSISDFIFFALLIFLVCKVHLKNVFSKRTDLFLLFLNLSCLILVGQTRGYTIMILAVLIYCFSSFLFKRVDFAIAFAFSILSALPILLLTFSLIRKIIFSDSSRLIAISIRLRAYKYYLDNITFSKWFSLGFVRDDLFKNILHGPGNLYNIDDVGIVGFLAIFGMLGIFLLIVLLFDFLVVFLNSNYKVTTCLILIVFLAMCVSLSIFNAQRIFYLPVIFSLLDFLTLSEKKGISIGDLT